MDVNLGYAAWLKQSDTQKGTIELTFDDSTGVLFLLSDHTTCINVTPELETQESDLD